MGRVRRRIALAQNFLTDRRLMDHLLRKSSIGADDVVYEIGPGGGAITERLARRCRHVVAVEQDPQLAGRLAARLARSGAGGNVSLYLGSFLDFPLPLTPYKVFANLPFNITAAVIGRLTQASVPPEDAYLVVQREAAARFLGLPDGPAETLAAALLRPWFAPSVMHRFDRHDFAPAPGVEVVLLRLHKRGPPLVAPDERQRYRDLVTACFVAWQPTVRKALTTAVTPWPAG